MSQTATILVIDDEPQIRKFLRISLVSQGYKVLEAGTGTEGLAQAALNKPDLLVLDLGLPDMDGQQVLREFREWSTVPVLVLSVRASEGQKVEALDNGANDYVTKPFGIQEFLARVRALLRQAPAGEAQQAALAFGPLTVDLAYRRVLLDGTEVALTRKEYAVLAQLARHPGRVITQQQLLKDIWGPTHTEDTHYLRIVVGPQMSLSNCCWVITRPGCLASCASTAYSLRVSATSTSSSSTRRYARSTVNGPKFISACCTSPAGAWRNNARIRARNS